VKKQSQSHHHTLNELNITPLLDLVFVLLVIFIITSPQLSNDLELSLPTGAPPPANAAPPKLHYVNVATDGTLSVNDQPVQLAQLQQVFTALRASDPDPSVVVKGGPDVDYERIIQVLDQLQQSEITKIGLATETVP
jgi:biopolymer transport protein ExbD